MRTALLLLCLVVAVSLATPAEAQFRDSADRSVQTQLYDTGSAATNALQSLFGAEHFRMAHSYEASFSSFGGEASSMGMYTNSMMWQFNSDWAARVDVSVAHPFTQTGGAFGQQDTQVFLRNAEVAYKPSDNFQVRMQVQQNPRSRYMSPYGRYGSRYGGVHGGYGFAPTPTGDLFWKN
jgi:hypothetical protein